MHPYSRASIASALNSRTLSLHGALGRSKSSRENLLMHAHAALLRWLISCVSSPSSLTRPPKYRNWVVWAYFCPAASMCCFDDKWWWRRSPFLRLFLRRPHQESLCLLLRHCQAKFPKHFHDSGHHSRQPFLGSRYDAGVVGIEHSPNRPPRAF